ncbi:[protein-PII] uridylyltransferase [Breoghania sp. L-A4]|uniref:[protein-PII] uridylyltransferase n=1 Tax=Breoghania sp. L-A4 TaxID=2304600 RepID=UPI000E35DAAA|nr:[protein-PII] uridylyltransferase [Breoghania sp. L-A4]AXS38930.1 [protein-PII] uridylyltransferase [Breoghania sp. L-A4]
MTSLTEPFPELIDSAALRHEFSALTKPFGGDGTDLGVRSAVLARLKEVYQEGRDKVEQALREDGGGHLCARRLCFLQDEIIRVIYDFAVFHVYRVQNPSAAEHMSVVAVGGYGRGTLAPASDIDLLFLLPYKQTPWGESVVEYILYLLWDLGLKVGHATRTVGESLRLSRSDMTIRTAILEARYVWGHKDLAEELIERFDNEVVKNTGPEFIAAKLAERDERHRRQGQSRYLVEPNVKEGKGGLRDLHTLFWIAKYFYRLRSGNELVKAGVFSRAEYNRFVQCDDFLWAVRCHMHFLTGRPEERLSFDIQREIAQRLSYTEHPGQHDVERFMKHYFLIAKDVGDLTRILCAALEEKHAKQTPGLSRFLNTLKRSSRRQPLGSSKDFVVENDRLNIAHADVFKKDPINLIRAFSLAERHDLLFHPELMKLVRRSRRLIDRSLRENPEANRLFIGILTSRGDPETVLRRMSEAGVLSRFVPDFGKVEAMMQFNMYHHYTVDEHLLRAIGVLSEIERGEQGDDHPLSTEILKTTQNRKVLYVALFLHDIAKGRPEDHSIAGARIARRLCPRFGLNAAETETVAWLIEHHLLMSTVAQSRDLNDRKTITDFAEVVQSPERLKLLLVLTVADIRAVGPNVFNGWKGQLLRTLYYECEPVLAGGYSLPASSKRVEAAQRELAEELEGWSAAEIEAYRERHYPSYWLRVDLPQKLMHAEMIRDADASGKQLASKVTTHAFEGITEITVLAADHPRLLSTIAGSCFVAGANIVDAQIYTTTDGLALDTIFVTRELPDDADERRRGERITTLISRTLLGEEKLPNSVAQKAATRSRSKVFRLETEVLVNNSWSDRYTVLETSGLDRPGLLYDLTREISALNLNIASAHIATFGERAVDVFYVTDLTGQKIANVARQVKIRERIAAAFDGVQPAKPVKQAKAAWRSMTSVK